jgi:hypothetical protein
VGTETLARTGTTVRWPQFWGGFALALGGVMLLLGRDESPSVSPPAPDNR